MISIAPKGLGISGFLSGSVQFKGGYTNSKVSLGARYSW
jgi:hypothetical protein